jgi:hypothetical protein
VRGRLVAAEAVLFDWKCSCGNPVVYQINDGGQIQGYCLYCFATKMAEISRRAFRCALLGQDLEELDVAKEEKAFGA